VREDTLRRVELRRTRIVVESLYQGAAERRVCACRRLVDGGGGEVGEGHRVGTAHNVVTAAAVGGGGRVVVAGGRVDAADGGVDRAELAAACGRAAKVDVGLRVVERVRRVGAAEDAARAVVSVEGVVVVERLLLGAALEDWRAQPIAHGRARVVVGTLRVGASRVRAAVVDVGALKEVLRRWIGAADDTRRARALYGRAAVVIQRHAVEAARVHAGELLDVGNLSVVGRGRVGAAIVELGALAVVIRCAGVVGRRPAVRAPANDAGAVVRDGKGAIVQRTAVGAALRRRGRRRRR